MPVEEDQMGLDRACRSHFLDPKQLLNRGARSALLLGVELENVEGRSRRSDITFLS